MAPENVSLFPLSQALLPDGLLQLTIFEVRYLHLIKRCQQDGLEFGVVPLVEGREVQKAGELETLHTTGCLARLLEVRELQPAVLLVKCEGTGRFLLHEHRRGAYGLWNGEITRVPAADPVVIPADLQRLADELGRIIAAAQKKGIESQLPMRPPYRLDECGWVADRWADFLALPSPERIQMISEDDGEQRLRMIDGWMRGA
jgi:Lon protease-like protein